MDEQRRERHDDPGEAGRQVWHQASLARDAASLPVTPASSPSPAQPLPEMAKLELRAYLRRGFPEWLGRDSGGVGLGSGTGIDGETARATGLRDRSDRRAMGPHRFSDP